MLDTQTVAHGTAAAAPMEPARTGYRFTGWSVAFDNITANTEVTAQYVKTWTVTFVDEDGTVLKTETVDEGAGATAPVSPSKVGYGFAGWNGAFDRITADTTVIASYTANQYTVHFVDWNGAVLETQTVTHGAAAAPTVTPVREGYTFTGWDVAFGNVTGNLTVTAQYVQTAGLQAADLQAAATGDASAAEPLLITGGASALAAAAVLFFRKKKKSDR